MTHEGDAMKQCTFKELCDGARTLQDFIKKSGEAARDMSHDMSALKKELEGDWSHGSTGMFENTVTAEQEMHVLGILSKYNGTMAYKKLHECWIGSKECWLGSHGEYVGLPSLAQWFIVHSRLGSASRYAKEIGEFERWRMLKENVFTGVFNECASIEPVTYREMLKRIGNIQFGAFEARVCALENPDIFNLEAQTQRVKQFSLYGFLLNKRTGECTRLYNGTLSEPHVLTGWIGTGLKPSFDGIKQTILDAQSVQRKDEGMNKNAQMIWRDEVTDKRRSKRTVGDVNRLELELNALRHEKHDQAQEMDKMRETFNEKESALRRMIIQKDRSVPRLYEIGQKYLRTMKGLSLDTTVVRELPDLCDMADALEDMVYIADNGNSGTTPPFMRNALFGRDYDTIADLVTKYRARIAELEAEEKEQKQRELDALCNWDGGSFEEFSATCNAVLKHMDCCHVGMEKLMPYYDKKVSVKGTVADLTNGRFAMV